MRRRRYAIVEVNTLPDFLVFAPIVARWMGAKIVLDMHEITPEFYMSKYGIPAGSLLVRTLIFVERISMRFADWVITINDPVRDLLCSRGLDRSKATILVNSVDERRHSASLPADGDRPAGRFVFMYHGTLTHIYGLDLAIDAFAIAHCDMPGAEFWILGSGTQQDALAARIAEHGLDSVVRLIGQVPPGEIPKWLAQCDLGILPIRSDVFLDYSSPNKLPELIVSGKPVLISRIRAIRHYYSEEALAYFEPNDPVDLARQMVRVYRDPALRDRLVVRAREEYVPLRWDVMKQRYLDVVRELSGLGREPAGRPRAAEGTAPAR
jgi:glycosyltransferase involved in cell wall biosynthesis